MRYILSAPSPQSRFLKIQATKTIDQAGAVEFQLSSWRPGRYELGNFARNLRGMKAEDALGKELPIHKTSKDRWRIDDALVGEVRLTYEYHCAQPDAGACWIDEELMYVNPVHALVFDPHELDSPSTVELRIPPDWQIACALSGADKRLLQARDVHELLDSPFFAARSLHHRSYSVNDYQFHIWMVGEARPDWNRILKDFKGFTEKQLDMMGSMPVPEFHFLVILLPYRFYHGVEHLASTVLALGPGTQLMQPALYNELMGVASHELFHVWNVKSLRPSDFRTYDYTRENYSRLGWVYEGFTTYYGDLFLLRSGFFAKDTFFNEISTRLQRHVDNPGRFHSSVAESSFDTWLDGYVPGVPGRKTSIYDEGCLIALLLDLYILRQSKGQFNLDDLYERLYSDTISAGYSDSDVSRIAKELSGEGVQRIFNECIYARNTYEDLLEELLDSIGCGIQRIPSKQLQERLYGFRTTTDSGICRVAAVWPNSPAEIAGLSKDDEIVGCNGWKVEGNLSERIAQSQTECRLTTFSMRREKHLKLEPLNRRWFDTVRIAPLETTTPDQELNFKRWMGRGSVMG